MFNDGEYKPKSESRDHSLLWSFYLEALLYLYSHVQWGIVVVLFTPRSENRLSPSCANKASTGITPARGLRNQYAHVLNKQTGATQSTNVQAFIILIELEDIGPDCKGLGQYIRGFCPLYCPINPH